MEDEMDGLTDGRVKKFEARESDVQHKQRRCETGAVGAENGLQKLIS